MDFLDPFLLLHTTATPVLQQASAFFKVEENASAFKTHQAA
jgi:hypothetical protein